MESYSSLGQTNVVYANSLTDVFIFLFTKSKVRFVRISFMRVTGQVF